MFQLRSTPVKVFDVYMSHINDEVTAGRKTIIDEINNLTLDTESATPDGYSNTGVVRNCQELMSVESSNMLNYGFLCKTSEEAINKISSLANQTEQSALELLNREDVSNNIQQELFANDNIDVVEKSSASVANTSESDMKVTKSVDADNTETVDLSTMSVTELRDYAIANFSNSETFLNDLETACLNAGVDPATFGGTLSMLLADKDSTVFDNYNVSKGDYISNFVSDYTTKQENREAAAQREEERIAESAVGYNADSIVYQYTYGYRNSSDAAHIVPTEGAKYTISQTGATDIKNGIISEKDYELLIAVACGEASSDEIAGDAAGISTVVLNVMESTSEWSTLEGYFADQCWPYGTRYTGYYSYSTGLNWDDTQVQTAKTYVDEVLAGNRPFDSEIQHWVGKSYNNANSENKSGNAFSTLWYDTY